MATIEVMSGGSFVSGEPSLKRYAASLRGMWFYAARYAMQLRGYDRGIEDASLRRYELYGAAAGDGATEWYDALGNLDPATAAATGTSLPLVYDPGGAGAYEVLLVRRNGHGVDSGNRTVVPVVVNGSGNEGFDPVGPVTGLRAVASGMRVRVWAEYLEGTEEAPTRFSGVVELPGASDVEFEVAMDVGVDGVGKLDVTLDVVGDPGTATIRVWAERVEADTTVTEGAESMVNLALPGAGLSVVRGMMVEDATGVAF